MGRVFFAHIQGDRGQRGRGRVDFARRGLRQLELLEQQLSRGRGLLGEQPPAAAVDASTATSAAAFGGMNGLIAAAKKEGS